MIKPNGWESGYSKIMLEWIETQWKLEKAHQAGEPYTRMKFEAECAKLENKLKDHISQAILSAEKNTVKRCVEAVKNIEEPDMEDMSGWYLCKDRVIETLSLPDQEQLSSKENQDE